MSDMHISDTETYSFPPDHTIIFQAKHALSREEADSIRAMLARSIPNKTLVVDNNWTITSQAAPDD